MKLSGNMLGKSIFYLLCLLVTAACHSDEKPEEAGPLPVIPEPEPEPEPGIPDCKAWTDFMAGNEANVLLDFSYAGYGHGETAPPDVWTLGYTVYDVTDYGAIPDDGKSDREALLKILDKIGINGNRKANALIYFPEGEFILYDESDRGDADNDVRMQIRAGNFILKGAGRDKTTITMAAPYPPLPNVEWAGSMFDIKNWNGFSNLLANVTGSSPKGSFSVEVASTGSIRPGDRVCLKLEDNSPELIAEELHPYQWMSSMTQLQTQGVQVYDFHEVKSVSGNRITFVEPIMHEVNPRWNWTVCHYDCYENVGVEDLSFKGQAGENFIHSQWYENSAYKPLSFQQIVNGWVRRVDFYSVSEAATFTLCANISAYDIRIGGNRGHCSVHTSGSSRVLIADVRDEAKSTAMANAGQWHAVGVSKQSLGTVIKDCTWGNDTNFESHATQPRATLLDGCTGGFLQSHQGGDTNQLPNHLDDLVLWNFCATRVLSNEATNWTWWSDERGWKFLPPVIVGFHGENVDFEVSQVKLMESYGQKVNPKSLYEAQLQRRLGYLPDIDYLQ